MTDALADLAAALIPAVRALHGQTPVAVNGSREIGARLGYYQAGLRDGTVGFCMRRSDDCLRASIATLLQVPMPNVPDLRPDAGLAAGQDPDELAANGWQTLARWADTLGLTIWLHPRPPTSERRWIGVISEPGTFNDHTIVLNKREILHDPSVWSLVPEGARLVSRSAGDVDYGITIT